MESEGSLPHSQEPSTCPYHSVSPCTMHVFMFRNKASFYGQEVSAHRPPQGGPLLVDCPRLLIQYIRSYPPNWRPFLHPQPEDAPCRGDTDPLITYRYTCTGKILVIAVLSWTSQLHTLRLQFPHHWSTKILEVHKSSQSRPRLLITLR